MRSLSRFKTSKRTKKFLHFWTMSAAESQKVAEDGQNKENLATLGVLCHKCGWLSFMVLAKSFQYNKSYLDQAFSVKMAGY